VWTQHQILSLLQARGYNDLGIRALLEATQVPKGSFSHHFQEREDFALQVFDQEMREVHAGLAACLAEIAARLAGCLDEAQRRGELPAVTDPRHMANILVDCWEGAALRSRLRQEAAPLQEMLDFYFRSAHAPQRNPSP
jgi:TetR/AcrR family transcriptional repressor of nem operon